MPLCDRGGIGRFQRELPRTSLIAFQQVTLPGQWFAPGPRPTTDILFKALDNGEGCIVLVDAGVRYIGNDGAVQTAFQNEATRGWRPLAVVRSLGANEVLNFADALLGLAGREPRVPRRAAPQPRELVVSRAEAIGGSDTGHETPESRFGVDLVEEARAGRLASPLFREGETAALVRVLSKAGKNAACLIGEPGVGKTAVVQGLAIAIAESRVPASLCDARILDVNLSFLGAGASMRGEFEGRVKELIGLARRDRRTVLFLDELHTVRGAASDASQMLKADLGRGRISCIGATTTAEWREIEADAALARRFQVIRVAELSTAQAAEVLRANKIGLERHHGVAVPADLITTVVDLSARYLPDRRLPDKALDLLDEACACAATNGVDGGAT